MLFHQQSMGPSGKQYFSVATPTDWTRIVSPTGLNVVRTWSERVGPCIPPPIIWPSQYGFVSINFSNPSAGEGLMPSPSLPPTIETFLNMTIDVNTEG